VRLKCRTRFAPPMPPSANQPLGWALRSRDDVRQAQAYLDDFDALHHPTPEKDWDLAMFQRRVVGTVPRHGRILDAGCASSPLLVNLARAGYADLWGLDFHLGDLSGLRHPEVRYLHGNLMRAPFPDGSFDAITCLSVVEHGCPPRKFFAEMARLLRPGGRLLVSTDYWPTGARTWTVRRRHTFGLPWTVFSRRALGRLRDEASRHGLEVAGDWDFEAGERVVAWNGRRYTFFAFELVRA
jgi:SAM-dependent methyltransferase